MSDKYLAKYKKALDEAKTEQEKNAILNKLYEDGFEDGTNEGRC